MGVAGHVGSGKSTLIEVILNSFVVACLTHNSGIPCITSALTHPQGLLSGGPVLESGHISIVESVALVPQVGSFHWVHAQLESPT